MIAWAKRHKGSGIIYKENRKGCERLAETLRSEGIDAMAFHAEMRDADKKRVQDGFLAGHPRVICATSAFGMGVDKPDVRWVLNDGPCKSLEAYWQEAGRAGRDGKPADAVLYWSPGDWRWLRHAAWEAKSRAEESGDPSRIRAAQLMDSRLDAMSAYCETRRCLRRTILAMFDPPGTRRDDCSNCSNCQADGREIVKKPASNPYRRRRTAPETGEGQGEPMGRESIRIAWAANRSASHAGTSRTSNASSATASDRACSPPPCTDPPAAASPNRDSNSSTGTARSPRAADPPYGT